MGYSDANGWHIESPAGVDILRPWRMRQALAALQEEHLEKIRVEEKTKVETAQRSEEETKQKLIQTRTAKIEAMRKEHNGMVARATYLGLKVTQSTDTGVLAQVYVQADQDGNKLKYDEEDEHPKIFLEGFYERVADGDPIRVIAYPDGVFRYTSVLGATLSIKQWKYVDDWEKSPYQLLFIELATRKLKSE